MHPRRWQHGSQHIRMAYGWPKRRCQHCRNLLKSAAIPMATAATPPPRRAAAGAQGSSKAKRRKRAGEEPPPTTPCTHGDEARRTKQQEVVAQPPSPQGEWPRHPAVLKPRGRESCEANPESLTHFHKEQGVHRDLTRFFEENTGISTATEWWEQNRDKNTAALFMRVIRTAEQSLRTSIEMPAREARRLAKAWRYLQASKEKEELNMEQRRADIEAHRPTTEEVESLSRKFLRALGDSPPSTRWGAPSIGLIKTATQELRSRRFLHRDPDIILQEAQGDEREPPDQYNRMESEAPEEVARIETANWLKNLRTYLHAVARACECGTHVSPKGAVPAPRAESEGRLMWWQVKRCVAHLVELSFYVEPTTRLRWLKKKHTLVFGGACAVYQKDLTATLSECLREQLKIVQQEHPTPVNVESDDQSPSPPAAKVRRTGHDTVVKALKPSVSPRRIKNRRFRKAHSRKSPSSGSHGASNRDRGDRRRRAVPKVRLMCKAKTKQLASEGTHRMAD